MRSVVASLVALMGGVIFADDAVSPAFTFDARYQASGLTPDAWVSYQAEGLSSRFSAATVTRAADANHNGISDEWEAQYNLAGHRLSNGAGAANFALKWQSAKGRIYSVYATTNLSEGWPEEPMAEITGTGDVLEYMPEQVAATQFFKVTVRLAGQ